MKMHWCTARVNLAGQGCHVVQLGQYNPISWPEAQVLILLHGDENVFDIKPCAVADVNPADEKRRLIGKYGNIVERVFPGRVFRMELAMPGEDTNQPLANGDGATVAVGDMGDASDEPDEPLQAAGPAVFKPGRLRPSAPAPRGD